MKNFINTISNVLVGSLSRQVRFVLLCLFLVTSCSQKVESIKSTTYEYAILDDASASNMMSLSQVDLKLLHDLLINECGIVEGEMTSNGARIYTMRIGQPYLPSPLQSSIEAKNWALMSRDEREQEITDFINLTEKNLEATFNGIAEDRQSNIFLGILFALSQLDHSADHRKIWVFTDALETVSIQMEGYNTNPEKMMKDYELLRDQLLKLESVSAEFAGTELVLIVPGDYKVVFEATKFWKRFFWEEFGINVEVKASL